MARGSDRGVLRRGGKRDFSPLVDTKAHTPRGAAHESQETRERVCVCVRGASVRAGPPVLRALVPGAPSEGHFSGFYSDSFLFLFFAFSRTIV